MRIKLQSFPPLPTFRAWFSIHSATTVKELKSLLCQELASLRGENLGSQDITLVLDDFDLLDFSPIDVIRDGDLILVKQRTFAAGEKRKSALDGESPSRKRVKRPDDPKLATRPKPAPAQAIQLHKTHAPPKLQHSAKAKPADSDSDSDSTSSSSTSESSSDSDSDSSSTTSSSEDESSASDSSSTSSAPSTAPNRPNGKAAPTTPSLVQAKPSRTAVASTTPKDKASAAPTTSVPPGLGKPTTHNRNVRRRRKRMFERLAATAEPASVNEIPLGARAQTAVPVPPPAPAEPVVPNKQSAPPRDIQPPVIMMSTLQNKNKKKGFKKMMASTFPAKIIFSSAGEGATVEQTLQEAIPFTNAEDREVLATFARLVPPSEKQEKGLLPPNMFVTSVDVEADLPKKRKKKQRQAPEAHYEEEEDIELPYDEPVEAALAGDPVAVTNGVSGMAKTAPAVNRQDVESRWTSLPKITEAAQLKPGVIIGWKELGINPQTFTPEMLLNVGKVVGCEQQLVVEQLSEHATAEVSFGGLIVSEEEQSIELGYDWTDVFQGDWRVLQM